MTDRVPIAYVRRINKSHYKSVLHPVVSIIFQPKDSCRLHFKWMDLEMADLYLIDQVDIILKWAEQIGADLVYSYYSLVPSLSVSSFVCSFVGHVNLVTLSLYMLVCYPLVGR